MRQEASNTISFSSTFHTFERLPQTVYKVAIAFISFVYKSTVFPNCINLFIYFFLEPLFFYWFIWTSTLQIFLSGRISVQLLKLNVFLS